MYQECFVGSSVQYFAGKFGGVKGLGSEFRFLRFHSRREEWIEVLEMKQSFHVESRRDTPLDIETNDIQ